MNSEHYWDSCIDNLIVNTEKIRCSRCGVVAYRVLGVPGGGTLMAERQLGTKMGTITQSLDSFHDVLRDCDEELVRSIIEC